MNEDDIDLDAPTVVLKDETGRSLTCYVERSMDIEGQDFVLLMPVDAPIEIFAWQADDEDDEAEVLVDVEETEIDQLFDTARAVLAEHDLTLQRTALTLTAAGDLPEAVEDELISLDIEGSISENGKAEPEQFQILASFFHNDQEYMACTPLDPLLFFARLRATGEPELLSPEEFQELRSQLEDKLFDELDDSDS